MVDDLLNMMYSREEEAKMREVMQTPFGPVTGGTWASYFAKQNELDPSSYLSEFSEEVLKHNWRLSGLPENISSKELFSAIANYGNSTLGLFVDSFAKSLDERSKKDALSGRLNLSSLLKTSSERFYLAANSLATPSENQVESFTVKDYSSSISDLAKEIESLRYDASIFYIKSLNSVLETKLSDLKNSPVSNIFDNTTYKNSIRSLEESIEFISRGTNYLSKAWNVCKPKMKESLEVFPEIIYKNNN